MKRKTKKKLAQAMSLMLVIITVLSLGMPAMAAGPTLPDGIYVFYTLNKQTNMNIAYKGGNGAIAITDNADGETNEIYILRNNVYGYFNLQPFHAQDCYLRGNGKGETLTIERGIPSSRAAQWQAVDMGGGRYMIKNRAWPNLVIDCANGHIGKENIGNRYLLWDINYYGEAQFSLPVRISELTDRYAPSNRISPVQTTCALGAAANQSMVANSQYAKGAGANIVLDNLSSPAEANETITLVPRGNNRYSMHFAHSPDTAIAASDIFASSPLTLKRFDANDPFQLWEVFSVKGGYSFRNCGNLMMFDNRCNGVHCGNPQLTYSYTGDGDPQIFYMKGVSTTTSGGASSAESAILSRLNDMMDGSYGGGTYKVGTKYTGPRWDEQCKGYARTVHHKIFGYDIGSTKAKPYNYKLNYYSSKTELVDSLTSLSSKSNSKVAALFDDARAGDFIQIRRAHTGSHSAIFLYSDSNSVTVLEANVDGRNTITKNTYSFSAFRSANAAVSVYTAKDYRLH